MGNSHKTVGQGRGSSRTTVGEDRTIEMLYLRWEAREVDERAKSGREKRVREEDPHDCPPRPVAFNLDGRGAPDF